MDPQMAQYTQAVLLRGNGTAGSDGGAGTVLLPGLVPPGTQLVGAADNRQPSVEHCNASCRKTKNCNLFWYCGQQVGMGHAPPRHPWMHGLN